MARQIKIQRYGVSGFGQREKNDRGIWCLWSDVAPYIKEARPTVRRVRPCNKRKVVITCEDTVRSPCKDRGKNRICNFPVGDCSAQVKTTIA